MAYRDARQDASAATRGQTRAASASAAPAASKPTPTWRKKAFWLKQVRTWHWISGAVTLVGMLMFAATGITLNHASQIEVEPRVRAVEAVLPDDLIAGLVSEPTDGETMGLPGAVEQWLVRELGVSARGRRAEWSDIDVYVGLPRPGGDAWLSIDRETGDVFYETTNRGAISYLNDLHKGRNTGTAWSWFLDVFSVAAIAFCLTGLWLLYLYAPGRKITWPLVLGGLAIPAALALVFIH